MVVARWDDLHHVDPKPPENGIVWGFHINHVELPDDVVRVLLNQAVRPCQVSESQYCQTRINEIRFACWSWPEPSSGVSSILSRAHL